MENREPYLDELNSVLQETVQWNKKAYRTCSINGNVLDSNSSNIPLSVDGTFTGEWEDVSDIDSIIVSVATDKEGIYNIQYSTDKVNIDSNLTRYHRKNEIHVPHRFTNTRQYVRVIFTNTSGEAQTYFRLQSIVGTRNNLNAPTDSKLSQDYDATVVRPTDYTTEVALGRREGVTTWNKFGYNTSISTTEEFIASWSSELSPDVSASTLNISSTSSDDDETGTGLQELLLIGVDENWDYIEEVVIMDGTNVITTTSQWRGIIRAKANLCGSSKSNVGVINVTASTGGRQMAQIPIGSGTSQQCLFFVPRNHQFLMTWIHMSVVKTSGGGNPQVTFLIKTFESLKNSTFEVYRDELDVSISEYITLNPAETFIFPEKTMIWMSAYSSAAETSIKGRFSGKLVRNVTL